MKLAVLDLGTNVFNMLLAAFSEKGCEYIKEFKCAAKLGAGGLASGNISEGAFETASLAMERILAEIEKAGGADKIVPYATSAVRDAQNGTDFVKYMYSKFGVEIEVIPGEREAELIFKGIMKSLPHQLPIRNYEFIASAAYIEHKHCLTIACHLLMKLMWKRSFPIGMARMREKFQYQEPIGAEVIREFEEYCTEVMEPLWHEIEKYRPSVFVGSSGSFDTFKDLMYGCDAPKVPSMILPSADLQDLHNMLLASTPEQRLAMPGMSPIRVDYIVLASVFTQMILRRIPYRIIYQSDYSLKEGGMAELYEKWLNGNI